MSEAVGHWEVAIIGAGPGGLGLAIALAESGRRDFVLLEAGDGVGGTWRVNTYPGAACDVPSHLYSYSFALKPDWTKTYATQPEILRYFEDCADRFGIGPHLRTGVRIEAARWDEAARHWLVTDDAGLLYEADVLVSAIGTFTTPSLPDIDGLSTFAGPSFHSARWEHEHDLRGRRVAVIGTGASAAQIVPELAQVCAQVDVYQRTPQWIMPRKDVVFTEEEKERFARDPEAMAKHREEIFWGFENTIAFRVDDDGAAPLEALARNHIEYRITDEELKAKLTPDYPFGCKRTLVCSDFYKALLRENVELHHRSHRPRHAGRCGQRGRHRARRRRHRAGHRIQGDRVPRGHRRGGPGRPAPARGLVRGGPCLPRSHRLGVPEFLHALRPQHQPGRQLDHRHPRSPGRLRGRARSRPWRPRGSMPSRCVAT